MVKAAVIFLIMVGMYLFYPFWSLQVRDDPFSNHYELVKSGMWREGDCITAAEAQLAHDYQCRKYTHFGRFLGATSRYQGASTD